VSGTLVCRPWPRNPRYLAREDGAIIGSSGRVLSPFLNKSNGRLSVKVPWRGKYRTTCVHFVVAEAWHGLRPEGMEVAHGNGDSDDNRPANLRWATHVENEADKLTHGTRPLGERHGMAKLTEETVQAIRAEYALGEVRQYELAQRYGVTTSLIGMVVRGRGWTHLDGAKAEPSTLRGSRHPRARLTEDSVRAIRLAVAGGTSQCELAELYGVAPQSVSNVIRRETWAHIA